MNEIARLKALNEYEIMDTLPEREFDDIVELACAVCDVPISLITLLDSRRQWFKARIGLAATETPIEQAFCYHAIKTPQDIMVVPDSLEDDRFKTNPLATGAPHVRFYAGAPLVTTSGEAIGTLCVIDNFPRKFTEEQSRILRILADRVIKQLELRKENLQRKNETEHANRRLAEVLSQLKGARKISRFGSWECEISTMHITWSSEMYALFGEPEGAAVDIKSWSRNVHPDYKDALRNAITRVFTNQQPGVVEYKILVEDKWAWHMATADIITDESGTPIRMVGAVLDITMGKEAEENRVQYVHTLEEMLFAVSHKFRKPVANYKTIANALRSSSVTPQQVIECIPFINDSANELDEYIHELNDFLHGKRIKLNGPKQMV